MVLFTLSPSSSIAPRCPFPAATPRASFAPPYPLTLSFRGRKTSRCLTVVTRAGPTTATYVSAFLLPLSLLAITILTSMRIADKLDRDFLEELAINQAIREEEEVKEEDVDIDPEKQVKQPSFPSAGIRNRPKREV
uniref:High chlorophyll fluorescence 153 n=1 Tax=Rhizophora mucronata TaxID=61149 RepID=A0A2P2INR8_RHIMU